MSTELKLENHIAVTSHQDIKGICQPFFEVTRCDYFDFIREYSDFSRIWLGTNANWTMYLYKNEYVKEMDFQNETEPLQPGWYSWDMLGASLPTRSQINAYHTKLKDAGNSFNIHNGIALIEYHDSFCEYYSFGSNDQHTKIIDDYLIHRDIYSNFVQYFKQEANDIIKQADSLRLILPWYAKKLYNNDSDKLIHSKDDNYFGVTQFYLAGKYRDIYLTRQQYNCAKLLARGKRRKEVASILKISNRTVDTYIDQMKLKLNLRSYSQLIDVFHAGNILD